MGARLVDSVVAEDEVVRGIRLACWSPAKAGFESVEGMFGVAVGARIAYLVLHRFGLAIPTCPISYIMSSYRTLSP